MMILIFWAINADKRLIKEFITQNKDFDEKEYNTELEKLFKTSFYEQWLEQYVN